MTTQPEALRLAEALDAWDGTLMMPAGWRQRASAELRRLSAVEAQRDTLLEALKTIKDTKRFAREMQQEWGPAAQGMVRMASAAIKAVEEGK